MHAFPTRPVRAKAVSPLRSATAVQDASARFEREEEQSLFPPFVRPDMLRLGLRTQARSTCAVARIENVVGDRNLVCTCVGMESYTE